MVSRGMKDNEIIDLFMEAGLDDKEITTAMKAIKDKTPENVYKYLEDLKKKEEDAAKEKEKDAAENARKHKEMLKTQAEYKKNQLLRVKEKIRAAQEENRRKDQDFDAETQKGYDDVEIADFFKIRVHCPEESKSFWIGLNENATAVDLYNKVKESYAKTFKLANYNNGEEVKADDTKLDVLFPSRTCMLELNGRLNDITMPKKN